MKKYLFCLTKTNIYKINLKKKKRLQCKHNPHMAAYAGSSDTLSNKNIVPFDKEIKVTF